MEVNKVLSFKSNELNKTDEKEIKTKAAEVDTDEEEESFIERNKLALGAVAAVGIATAAILMIRSRKVKGKEIKQIKSEFEDILTKLKNGEKNENIAKDLDKYLKHENDSYKAGMISELIYGSHIDEELAPKVFDAISSIKSQELEATRTFGNIKVKKSELFENLYNHLKANKKFTPKVIDEFIQIISGKPAEEKLQFAHFLSGMEDSAILFDKKGVLQQAQKEKIAELIRPIEEKEFTSVHSYRKEKIETEDLKLKYERYCFGETFDKAAFKKLMSIMDNSSYSEAGRMIFADNTFRDKIWLQDLPDGIDYTKELFKKLSGFECTNAKSTVSYGREVNRFSVMDRLFVEMQYSKAVSNEEKFEFASKLTETYKTSKNAGVYFDAYEKAEFNRVLSARLSAQSNVFNSKFVKNTSNTTEMNKAVDDILNNYTEALNLHEDIAYGATSSRKAFELDFDLFELRLSNSKDNYSKDANSYNKILKKVRDFGKEKFGKDYTKQDNYNSWSDWNNNSGGSRNYNYRNNKNSNSNNYDRYNSGGRASSYVDAVKQKYNDGKATLLRYVKENDDMQAFIETLKKEEISGAELKTIYRKLAVKYHPDKAMLKGVSKEEAERMFSEINNANDAMLKYLNRN